MYRIGSSDTTLEIADRSGRLVVNLISQKGDSVEYVW